MFINQASLKPRGTFSFEPDKVFPPFSSNSVDSRRKAPHTLLQEFLTRVSEHDTMLLVQKQHLNGRLEPARQASRPGGFVLHGQLIIREN